MTPAYDLYVVITLLKVGVGGRGNYSLHKCILCLDQVVRAMPFSYDMRSPRIGNQDVVVDIAYLQTFLLKNVSCY